MVAHLARDPPAGSPCHISGKNERSPDGTHFLRIQVAAPTTASQVG